MYDGNNAFEVQQLLNDLDSISAGLINVGGDFAEYGMHGIYQELLMPSAYQIPIHLAMSYCSLICLLRIIA